ncbi:unnamed protein product [Leptosia nina]|uniref:Transmembrane protein 17 n=1 Tax=Leptosia nina TaxID=320188 RepID=A0AAV1JUK2_9NEOP
MNYKLMLYLQKCLFVNSCVYVVWVFTIAFFFYTKINHYDHIVKYLSVTLCIMFIIIEIIRLYLGQTGNLLCRVPELSSFLMLSIFMQAPVMTYFLFNPYLMNTPIETVLHAFMWVIILLEILVCFPALKQACSIAKTTYLSSSKIGRE